MMRVRRTSLLFWLLLATWLSWACTGQPSRLPDEAYVPTSSPAPRATIASQPTITATEPLPSPSPTLTATPEMRVCSPLPGYSLEQLQTSISNPFHPPRLGSDDPHQGVDFAVQQNGIALPGETVQVVLGGLVATVVNDRFPYGNAIIVETPLEDIPREWIEKIQAPGPIPTLSPHPSLTCPNVPPADPWNLDQRSLYLLYAHMLEPTTTEPG